MLCTNPTTSCAFPRNHTFLPTSTKTRTDKEPIDPHIHIYISLYFKFEVDVNLNGKKVWNLSFLKEVVIIPGFFQRLIIYKVGPAALRDKRGPEGLTLKFPLCVHFHALCNWEMRPCVHFHCVYVCILCIHLHLCICVHFGWGGGACVCGPV